ncbi:GDP-D-glucose phosphorylase 1-like [Stylophora pistillata]|uniref:GDP-D-glucose phosphorylase 1-like n=1 Tax=Stylophora pistillata TaxID=50429 RepID=UPI000C04DFB3|nr:GDP-D-glucose phosphorylase 1-like [Stylophora pistillata]
MSTPKMTFTDKKYFYTAEDFQWSRLWPGNGDEKNETLELSKFDKELQECWDAALEAGSFAYKLHHVEGRIVPGRYGVFVQGVSLVCENVYEVNDYPTTTFVFELAPETDVGFLARTIHKVSSYFIQEEVAHNLHIIRGARCRPSVQMNGLTQVDSDECSVLRVYLWPRNPVHGAKELSSYESEKRPIAVYEFAGSLAVENYMAAPCSGICSLEQQFSYTENDFHWPSGYGNRDKLQQEFTISKFDEKLQTSWNAAVDAGYFTYKLDCVDGRIAPGKYHLYVQLNELRFSKRRKPDLINKVSQPFDPSKFNFTKVPQKEVMFELIPKHRGAVTNDRHVMIINNSPIEYGHSLLVPSINSCLPQILTEEALLLSMETALLSSHRGFRVGFNSLCAYSSVNHLHFHLWYCEHPSYLQTVVSWLVICLGNASTF